MTLPRHHFTPLRRVYPVTTRGTNPAPETATLIVFLALAAFFFVRPTTTNWPDVPPPVVSASALVPGPMRPGALLTDPPQAMINGFVRDCNDCHRLMKPPAEAARRLTQHTHLVLDHGMNDRCFNCHSRENRNRLVSHTQATIGFDQSEQLCAQCHGPTYRDWERGIHGKSVGSWVIGGPQRVRLTCVQCHNPHAPRYAPMHPLPGPHTLRMGDQRSNGEFEEHQKDNPLLRYQREEDWPYKPIHVGVEPEPSPYDTPPQSDQTGDDGKEEQ